MSASLAVNEDMPEYADLDSACRVLQFIFQKGGRAVEVQGNTEDIDLLLKRRYIVTDTTQSGRYSINPVIASLKGQEVLAQLRDNMDVIEEVRSKDDQRFTVSDLKPDLIKDASGIG